MATKKKNTTTTASTPKEVPEAGTAAAEQKEDMAPKVYNGCISGHDTVYQPLRRVPQRDGSTKEWAARILAIVRVELENGARREVHFDDASARLGPKDDIQEVRATVYNVLGEKAPIAVPVEVTESKNRSGRPVFTFKLI